MCLPLQRWWVVEIQLQKQSLWSVVRLEQAEIAYHPALLDRLP